MGIAPNVETVDLSTSILSYSTGHHEARGSRGILWAGASRGGSESLGPFLGPSAAFDRFKPEYVNFKKGLKPSGVVGRLQCSVVVWMGPQILFQWNS